MSDEKVKKKDTVRISQKDLLKLLAEHEHMTNQITELQTRGTELITENRDLKKQIQDLEQQMGVISALQAMLEVQNKSKSYDPGPELFNPDIYIDGSRHY